MSNIQGIGSMQGMGAMMGARHANALTDDQKATLQSILSKYDSSNVSTDDALSIFEQLAKAGIKPGKGMKDAIEAAGFDAEDLRTKALNGMGNSMGMPGMGQAMGMQGPPPPPPPGGGKELSSDQVSTLTSILSKYDSSNVTSSDAVSIFKELQSAGITPVRGFKEAFASAGFDVEKVRDAALTSEPSIDNYFWAAQKTSQGTSASALQSLKSILDQYDLNNLTSTDQNNLFSALQSTGLLQQGSFLQLGGLLNTGA